MPIKFRRVRLKLQLDVCRHACPNHCMTLPLLRPFAWLALILALALPPRAVAAAEADVLLVLAVDCSGSVDEEELHLQLHGIAQALRDPEVIAAALSGPRGQVAINVLNWADAEYPKYATGWAIIDSPEKAAAFAMIVEGFNKREAGATGIGAAIAHAIGLIEASGIEAPRKVIDVSGDGIEAWQMAIPEIVLEDAHRMREAAGITVNGLAIRNDFQMLDRYYRDFVIGGPGAFVMDVADYSTFATAIRQKMLRELRPLTAMR
jgi:hypothetical protein